MTLDAMWKLLHLFFAFSFVGALVVADWNGRAARTTTDWGQRALLFRIVHLATRAVGLGSLILLGVFGQIASLGLGYRMSADGWIRMVTGLWLVAVLVMTIIVLPSAARLAALARAAAEGGASDGYEVSLKRWRLGNLLLSLLYLAMLTLMVLRWRS